MKRATADFKNGTRSLNDLQSELEDWRSQPFQLDVADFFLNGPGREESPFKEFFAIVEPPHG